MYTYPIKTKKCPHCSDIISLLECNRLVLNYALMATNKRTGLRLGRMQLKKMETFPLGLVSIICEFKRSLFT